MAVEITVKAVLAKFTIEAWIIPGRLMTVREDVEQALITSQHVDDFGVDAEYVADA